jgi:hypothetical protein
MRGSTFWAHAASSRAGGMQALQPYACNLLSLPQKPSCLPNAYVYALKTTTKKLKKNKKT